jgi:branched-subunit amino acid permease
MEQHKFMLIGVAAALVAILVMVKKKGALAGVAQNVGEEVGAALVAVPVGVVLGLGDGFGIPRTDMTECEKAIAEGRTWDASFACPASDFLGYMNPFK